MKTEPTGEFDDAADRFFLPLAKRAGLQIKKLCDGIYEIPGRTFVMRIRQGTGHRRDFLVTLAPKSSLPDNLDDLSQEIGLGVVAEYNGKQLQVQSDYHSDFAEAAKIAEMFCIPYLLDTKKDFEEIRRFVECKITESGLETKKYRFPHNVREEWI